jgi:hypothetical protein
MHRDDGRAVTETIASTDILDVAREQVLERGVGLSPRRR